MTQATEVSIPECFSYYQTVNSEFGKAMRWQFERFAKSHLDVSEHRALSFGRAMNTGDPLGDAYIIGSSSRTTA